VEVAVSTMRTELNTRLDALLDRERRLEPHLRSGEADDVIDALDAQAREEIVQIRAALRRLDQGTWGRCAACGDPLPEARLAAVPEATHCGSCARFL
jgi:RNA polymerase-binding transcription factor DksA